MLNYFSSYFFTIPSSIYYQKINKLVQIVIKIKLSFPNNARMWTSIFCRNLFIRIIFIKWNGTHRLTESDSSIHSTHFHIRITKAKVRSLWHQIEWVTGIGYLFYLADSLKCSMMTFKLSLCIVKQMFADDKTNLIVCLSICLSVQSIG